MSWQTTDLTIEAELAYRRERLTAELARAHARRDERRARRAADRGRSRHRALRSRLWSVVHRPRATGWWAVSER